jgi:hypothetical protein
MVGIGPMNSSLLDKLGLKNISQLSDDELRKLVSNDRQNRALVRAAGRVKRIAKDKSATKTHRVVSLESIGLAPALIAKLRASGKSDGEIISDLKSKGII